MKIKGKDLKIGQNVLLVKGPKLKRPNTTILTVLAIERPFVVFEMETPGAGRMILAEDGPRIVEGSLEKKRHIVHVEKQHRFQVLTDEFVAAAKGDRTPAWLHEGSDD